MSVPFYVSPEQQMADRAEFARKGISRGRSVIALACEEGIAVVAENPSPSLRKVSEIYDRIALGAVGRYNEFEALRIMGIRQADLRGYSYDRQDVTARSLAGQYSQMLGGTFASAGEKPYEVELVLAELGRSPQEDRLFHITHDGTIAERPHVVVLGGNAERLAASLEEQHDGVGTLVESVRAAQAALDGGSGRAGDLEVGVLDRTLDRRRRFRRVSGDELSGWLS